jgi:hypothetical protein
LTRSSEFASMSNANEDPDGAIERLKADVKDGMTEFKGEMAEFVRLRAEYEHHTAEVTRLLERQGRFQKIALRAGLLTFALSAISIGASVLATAATLTGVDLFRPYLISVAGLVIGGFISYHSYLVVARRRGIGGRAAEADARRAAIVRAYAEAMRLAVADKRSEGGEASGGSGA